MGLTMWTKTESADCRKLLSNSAFIYILTSIYLCTLLLKHSQSRESKNILIPCKILHAHVINYAFRTKFEKLTILRTFLAQ